jgi:hypothetical protein
VAVEVVGRIEAVEAVGVFNWDYKDAMGLLSGLSV